MEKLTPQQLGRSAFSDWQEEIQHNVYAIDTDFQHSIQWHFGKNAPTIEAELNAFGARIALELEPLVRENNLSQNLPRLDAYDAIGNRIDHVQHHPTYVQAGDIIYGSGLLKKMSEPGGLAHCLSLLFLSSQTGEAGHNCPIACSAGIIRVLLKTADFADKKFYLEKLTTPAFSSNFTGAQFLTEIQGGSDVGLNAVQAKQDAGGNWLISGEKWFCSNANADLIFLTARYSAAPGTKGLALFLIPAQWHGKKNHYQIRRLKDKIGTRTMATGEIDFTGAHAIQIGNLDSSFHLVMDNVLHLSRIFNAFCVLGMARRAYTLAHAYAKHRIAFGQAIINYPLVIEHLARIKAENTAMLAGMYQTIQLQDAYDLAKPNSSLFFRMPTDHQKLLLRLLVNLNKYLTAVCSVEHIHHCLDVLAGNGTIETFSPIPRLLRDSIVCENWEGTHNLLRAQIHKDILKYHIDEIYITYMRACISTLKPSSTTSSLLKRLESLTADLQSFRMMTPELQALEIKYVVDQMAMLFSAWALLCEAEHQTNTTGEKSKQYCYDYYSWVHIEQKPQRNVEAYLALIKHVVGL